MKTGRTAETQSVHIWLVLTTYVLIRKSSKGKQLPLLSFVSVSQGSHKSTNTFLDGPLSSGMIK